jgi:proteic killer suppression protein
MEIDFKNKKLRELCENRKKAEAELGSDGAKKLRTRLSDLYPSPFNNTIPPVK